MPAEIPESPAPETRYRRELQIGEALRSLVRSRPIIRGLVVRQVRSTYSQQILGLSWAILTPLLQMILFTILLNHAGTKAGINTGGVPKSLFLYVGLVAWAFFASSVSSGGSSLIGNPLLNKVYAPREVFPIAQVGSSAIDACASALVLPLLFIVSGRMPSATIYWVPLLLLILTVFTLAVALLISAITVYARDLRSGLPLLLQLGMFLPGVLYPVAQIVPESRRGLYAAAFPVGTVIDGIRISTFHDHAPNLTYTGIAGVAALVYLAAAFLVFKRLETGFADVS